MKCSSRVVLWTADTWKATAGRIRRRTDWISKRQRRFRPDTNCFNFHYLWSFWKREANRRGLGIDRVPPGPRFSSEFATLSLTPFLINEVQWMDGDAAISNHRKGSETKQKKGGNQPSDATDVSGAANLKLPGPLILETSAIQQTRRPSWLGSCTSAKCKWRAWKLKFLFFPSMRRYIYFETFSLSAGSVSACCTASINGIW